MEPFSDVYLQSKFDVSILRDWSFQTGHFAAFEQFKVDIHVAKTKNVLEN